MPAYDIDSESRGDFYDPLPPDHWSMPVGRIGGVRVSVSYAVFVALAVLAGLVAMVQSKDGNADLPVVAATAVAIWMVGWMAQLMVQFALHFGTSAQSESMCLGLVGVENVYPLRRRHPWTALANLTGAFCTLTALVTFGAVSLVIHMRSQSLDLALWSSWAEELSTPGFGMDAVHNYYLTATWLFWIQAACQAYPMPRHLGRGAIASAIALFAAEAGKELQIKLLRRFLQLIAIVTLVIAMATLVIDQQGMMLRSIALVFLSIYLWMSSHHQDLQDWVTSVHIAADDPAAGHLVRAERSAIADKTKDAAVASAKIGGPKPWVHALVDSVRMRQKRKRARAAWQREREEADDAAKLDEVLQRVSETGTDGLSEQDRALLQRVSDNLRRHRERRLETGHTSDET